MDLYIFLEEIGASPHETLLISVKTTSMPELPEIEKTRLYVEGTSLHKKIVDVECKETKMIKAPAADIKKALQGKELKGTARLGKYLFLEADKEHWLVLHFGMTGKMEYYQNQEKPDYAHLILTFEDHSHLAYTSRRRLGKIWLTSSVEDFKKEHSLGKDALEFTWKEFDDLLQKKKGSIKSLLMDQHSIAGIGNMYSDEIVYQCGIHPKTKVEKLTDKERKAIFNQMSKVLNTVIKNEGKRKDLPDNYITRYRKEGADCPDGKGKVEKIKISGRSTYFCPSCQEIKE